MPVPNEEEIRVLLSSPPPTAATKILMDRLLWDMYGELRGEKDRAKIQAWLDRYLIRMVNDGLFWTDKLRLKLVEGEDVGSPDKHRIAWSLEPLPEMA